MRPDQIDSLLQSTKDLLLKQAQYDIYCNLVWAGIWLAISYFLYRIVPQRVDKTGWGDDVKGILSVVTKIIGAVCLLAVLADLDTAFSLYHNPLFLELKSILPNVK